MLHDVLGLHQPTGRPLSLPLGGASATDQAHPQNRAGPGSRYQGWRAGDRGVPGLGPRLQAGREGDGLPAEAGEGREAREERVNCLSGGKAAPRQGRPRVFP